MRGCRSLTPLIKLPPEQPFGNCYGQEIPKHIGMMMGYTLMLLCGFLESNRTQDVINYVQGQPTLPADPSKRQQ